MRISAGVELTLLDRGRIPTTPFLSHDSIEILVQRTLYCGVCAQLCLTICDPMDCSPPGFSDYGILQARTLEWIAISYSMGSSWPRDWKPTSTVSTVKLLLTLGNPMDCSLPGSYIHGNLQARTLEWVAIPFSRGSSQLRDRIQVSSIPGRLFTIRTKESVN